MDISDNPRYGVSRGCLFSLPDARPGSFFKKFKFYLIFYNMRYELPSNVLLYYIITFISITRTSFSVSSDVLKLGTEKFSPYISVPSDSGSAAPSSARYKSTRNITKI